MCSLRPHCFALCRARTTASLAGHGTQRWARRWLLQQRQRARSSPLSRGAASGASSSRCSASPASWPPASATQGYAVSCLPHLAPDIPELCQQSCPAPGARLTGATGRRTHPLDALYTEAGSGRPSSAPLWTHMGPVPTSTGRMVQGACDGPSQGSVACSRGRAHRLQGLHVARSGAATGYSEHTFRNGSLRKLHTHDLQT